MDQFEVSITVLFLVSATYKQSVVLLFCVIGLESKHWSKDHGACL